MIEELNEYLIRHGWDEDMANDIHEAVYLSNTEQEEKDNIDTFMKDVEERIDEALCCVKAWRIEVGEI